MLGMDHNKACLKFLIRNYYFSLDDLFIVSSAHNWWERGKSFQRQASFSLFLLSYPRHFITKFFLEDLQLSSFFCQRTASPLTDCSSITDPIDSHSIFAVRFLSCLPTSATEKVVQNPKEQSRKHVLIRSTQKKTPAEQMIEEGLSPHWVTSGIIESCHLCNWTVLFKKERTRWQELSDKRITTV